MKVAITGYRGFIASKLLSYFELSMGIDEDYTKEELYNRLNDFKPKAIFHIGACSDTLNNDFNYMLEKNFLTTKWIADWCYENKVKLIYASSAAVYGTNGKNPSNLYGWTKLLGEDYVILRGGIALRYFNVYGPGEEHKGKMASIIYQNWNKKKVKLFSGKPKRDFVYIDDVTNANIYALINFEKLKGKWYEVGTSESNTFETIFNILNIPIIHISKNKIPKGYQFYTCSDNTKWMPGWIPKYNLHKGLENYKKYLNEKS